MSYFDQRPHLVRLLFGIVALYLFGLSGINIYKFGSSPTDENVFQDPHSDQYFIVNVPAERYDEKAAAFLPDSIRIGDMPTGLDGKTFESSKAAVEYFNGVSDTAMITVQINRPTEKRDYRYRLAKSALSLKQARELGPTAWVTTVTEGGASDRAGMKVGDLITRINGQTFKNSSEADQILRNGQIGKAIEYEVLRNNELLTLHVTLASFGFPIAFLLFVIGGLLWMIVGTFLAESRPQFMAARLLGGFFLFIGFVMSTGPIQRGLDIQWLILVRNITSGACFMLAPALLLHSLHYFPKERPDLLRRRWIRITGYALSIGAALATIPLPPNADILVIAVYALYTFTVTLFFRKEATADYKSMSRPARWASLATAGAILGFMLLNAKLGDRSISLLGYLGMVLLCVPASYLYTINRYRLMNLALRIRRNVQYSFVSVLWTLLTIVVVMSAMSWLVQAHFNFPYIHVTGQSIEVVGTPPTPMEQSMMEKGFIMGAAILATLLFSRVYKGVGAFIARKFHRARYDYRRAGSELADVMSTTLNMTQLARAIVEKIASLMQLKKAGILFFRNQTDCCCSEAHGFDGATWNEFCMTVDEELVAGLRGFSNEVGVEYLPRQLKERLCKYDFHYIIPIRSKEKLVGAILIGEKMSEAPFQHEDLEFLAAGAKQASVAIENAFLYEELSGQERMKHELEIARRIQLASLPQKTPSISGLDIAGASIPAMEVGGDYYDYLNGDPRKLTVIVGDVSGKGTSAALYMSKVQGIMRSLHGFGLSPKELFVRTNTLLCQDMEKKSFVTAMGGFFKPETREIILARAGHLPLFHYKAASKSVDQVVPRGLGLGLNAEGKFSDELEERTIRYGNGDVFLFVTDGVTEAQKTGGEQFGEERLELLLKNMPTSTALDIRDKIIADVKAFAGNANQHDDQTIVVVRVV